MIFRSKVTVDGLEYVVIPTKQGSTVWQKVLTRGLGGKKWRLLAVNEREIPNKHYKDLDVMRHWISTYEKPPYEIWVHGNSLTITDKSKLKAIVEREEHGCTILDAVHSVNMRKEATELPITVGP
jgi:hypothetical protein